MSETLTKDNLPENHELWDNIKLVTATEDSWKPKDSDEVRQKWVYSTEPDAETGFGNQLQVFSSTDKDNLKLNEPLDIVVKKSIGKDGKFYGYTLVAFAPHGQEIKKKESQSRFQKSQRASNRAIALEAASRVYTGCAGAIDDPITNILVIADQYLSWLDGSLDVKDLTDSSVKKA